MVSGTPAVLGGEQGHRLVIVLIHLLSLLVGVCESRGEPRDAETLMTNDHLLIPQFFSAHLLYCDFSRSFLISDPPHNPSQHTARSH